MCRLSGRKISGIGAPSLSSILEYTSAKAAFLSLRRKDLIASFAPIIFANNLLRLGLGFNETNNTGTLPSFFLIILNKVLKRSTTIAAVTVSDEARSFSPQ